MNVDVERRNLIKELNDLNEEMGKQNEGNEVSKKMGERFIQINQRLEMINADDAVFKAKEILKGLGFSDKDMSKKTKEFSGGWRMRISLAKALFVQPDLLLLDEPTNHLDMNAVMWLEDYLCSWPYTLVIVSHARDFINNVATDIIHLINSKLYYYKGTYNDFEKARMEKAKNQARQKESQEKKIEHLQAFVDRFRANAKRASMVQSKIKVINKIELIEEIIQDPSVIFIFPTIDKINPPILRLDNVDLSYGERQIITKVNISVDMSSRIAVVGPNGAGKTTLMKSLIGELNQSHGSLYRYKYFSH